ncbi:hypothetical protein GCM10010402_27580 [Actinomadura luteofluorescens]
MLAVFSAESGVSRGLACFDCASAAVRSGRSMAVVSAAGAGGGGGVFVGSAGAAGASLAGGVASDGDSPVSGRVTAGRAWVASAGGSCSSTVGRGTVTVGRSESGT